MPEDIDLQQIAMFLLAFIIANTIHEFGHAITADVLGDDTPRRNGRVTLNPIEHLDPIGTIAVIVLSVLGRGFGWGKPVPITPSRFKNPRMGAAIVAVAGPLTNLIQAIILAAIMRTGYFQLPPDSPYIRLIDIAFDLNVTLMVFNLVPIPPLDGSHILAAILPPSLSDSYRQGMARYGTILFIVFVFAGFELISPQILRIEDVLRGACILL